ncbi:MAG: YqgE/AlgH family protein [Pirellulales bacterium]
MSNYLSGQFLIASPYLTDPNFYRSVVLIIEHNADGAFGLVLNRPSGVSVRAMWQQTMQASCDIPAPVYLGGPIAGPIMLLHSRPADSDLQIVDGTHFSSERNKILRLITNPPTRLRVFNGYSGWGAGQLDREMAGGGWLTRPAASEQIFGLPDDHSWHVLTRAIGRDITSGAGPLTGPENPSWN